MVERLNRRYLAKLMNCAIARPVAVCLMVFVIAYAFAIPRYYYRIYVAERELSHFLQATQSLVECTEPETEAVAIEEVVKRFGYAKEELLATVFQTKQHFWIVSVATTLPSRHGHTWLKVWPSGCVEVLRHSY